MFVAEDVNQYPAYPYHCIMRLPCPGAVPSDGLAYCDYKEGNTLTGHHYWGTAVYSRKLTQEEIEHYDLEPTCFCVCD